MCRKLCLLTFLVLVIGLAVSNQAAETIYYDNFDGSASVDLNGLPPDIRPGDEVWVAGPNDFDADGAIFYDGTEFGDSAYLPFEPASGYVYELSATLDAQYAAGDDPNGWLALGFTQYNTSPESRFYGDNGSRNPIYWALSRTTESDLNDQDFNGPDTGGGSDFTTQSADNLKIILDTSATTWTVSWYFNDSLHRTVNVASAQKPNFHYVAICNNQASGSIDDFLLTRELGPRAANPSPADEVTDVPRDANLSWSPGLYADKHDVYFGTNLNDVNNATDPNTLPGRGRQDANSYDPGPMAFGTKYYWRIDEVNLAEDPNIWKGNVWSFTTEVGVGIIYYEDFDGPADVNLDGTKPDITTGDANWVAGSDFDADGTITWDNVWMGDSAYLPFVPADGYIYELSADLNATPGRIGGQNDWIALGFTQYNSAPESRFYDDNGSRNPIYWAISRTNEADAGQYDQTFTGVGTSGGQNSSTQSADNIRTVLNTVGDTWVVKWYFNGNLERTVNVSESLKPNFQYVAISTNRIHGTVDEFLLEGHLQLQAWNPNPEDDELVYTTDVTLQWEAGAFATQHDVYFDTDEAKVTDANRDNHDGLMHYNEGQTAKSYSVTGLTFGETYYWRIDEVNLPDIWPGEIWSFKVQPLTAYNPSPPDEDKNVDVNEDLAWTAGAKAKTHDVYLGTDEDAVTDANTTNYASLDVEYWNVSDPCKDPGTLSFGTEYFWRIDEVNTTIWKGDVWSFTTEPYIPITDPNLIGYWTFDEGEGTKALDHSGHRNHGTLFNDPLWSAGYIEGALNFDGLDDYVDLPIGEEISSMNDCTIATWVNFGGIGSPWQGIFDFFNDDEEYMYLSPLSGWGTTPMQFGITSAETGESLLTAPSSLPTGWHHVTVIIDGTSKTMELYLDGSVVDSGTTETIPSDLGETTYNWLGGWHTEGNRFQGFLDEFYIYNKVLTEDELIKLISPPWAWMPDPPDNANVSVAPRPILSWMPGKYADKHDVYFGTDETAVTDANRTNPLDVLVKQGQDPCSYDPCTIGFGQTYYWRIDEVNMAADPNIWRGYVWSFTTAADYIEIDNFDRYLTRDELRDVWKDGYVEEDTSSNITVSTAIDPRYPPGHEPPGPIHEGTNALQFVYDNDAWVCVYVPDETGYCNWRLYYYSEMEATMDDLGVSDWTTEGVKSLSLQFYGDPCNSVIGDVNQMYIAIEDGNEHVAIVKYGSDADYENMNDLKKTKWQQWNIDLQRFVNANANLDLNDVNKVYIGIGIRGNDDTAGGYGIVYFDSIRLYLPRCVPERVAAGDLSGDCDFNLDDFVIMADGWLCGEESGSPDSNLIGQWKFDEASGTTANDSIGTNHGTVIGGAVLNGSGQLTLDGVDDYVSLPIGSVISTLDECSFAAWVEWPGTGGDWQRIFDFGHPNEPNLADLNEVTNPQKYTFSTPSPFRFVISLEGPGDPPEQIAYGTPSPMPSGLHCVVVTVDVNDANENNTILSLYLDGRLAGRNTDANLVPSDLGNTPNNWLGRSLYAVDPYLIGSYDEFRIYNRVLSEFEIAKLYCSTLARPRADLSNDGVVDFKDMAMIIDKWLQGPILWP